jgi:hypothetical protein
MASRFGRLACFGLFVMLAPGCAARAIRPPTPAAELDRAAINFAAPDEHFYVLIFASQRHLRRPAYSHTWATVVRAVDRPGQCPAVDQVDTISWLPATLKIRVLRPCVEPGTNFSMHESIVYAKANRERVSMWGPYECQPSLYRRFLVQKEFIDSGQIGYQCNDNVGEAARKGNGCCCIHAITDMDPEYGRGNYPLLWYGDPASEHIVNRIHQVGALLHPEVEDDWLLDPLGLNDCTIVRRHYHDRLINFPRVQPERRLRSGGSSDKHAE